VILHFKWFYLLAKTCFKIPPLLCFLISKYYCNHCYFERISLDSFCISDLIVIPQIRLSAWFPVALEWNQNNEMIILILLVFRMYSQWSFWGFYIILISTCSSSIAKYLRVYCCLKASSLVFSPIGADVYPCRGTYLPLQGEIRWDMLLEVEGCLFQPGLTKYWNGILQNET